MPIKAYNASTRPLICWINIYASCTHAYNSRMCATRDGVLILLRMHGLVSPEFPLSTATKLRNPTHADDHLHTHEQHTRTPPEDHSKTQSVTKEQSAERRGGGREYACCKLHNKPGAPTLPTYNSGRAASPPASSHVSALIRLLLLNTDGSPEASHPLLLRCNLAGRLLLARRLRSSCYSPATLLLPMERLQASSSSLAAVAALLLVVARHGQPRRQ